MITPFPFNDNTQVCVVGDDGLANGVTIAAAGYASAELVHQSWNELGPRIRRVDGKRFYRSREFDHELSHQRA